MQLRSPLLVLVLGLCSLPACAAQLTPKDHAAATRAAMPKCLAGDNTQCREACEHGGSNKACQHACDANHGGSCAILASRLDREQDIEDAEAQATAIAPAEPEEITGLYERACKLGAGASCVHAGGRILTGKGRGKRGADVAVDLLKSGCVKYRDGGACCVMSELNMRLAEGKNANTITDFRAESKRWGEMGRQYGASCATELPRVSTLPNGL